MNAYIGLQCVAETPCFSFCQMRANFTTSVLVILKKIEKRIEFVYKTALYLECNIPMLEVVLFSLEQSMAPKRKPIVKQSTQSESEPKMDSSMIRS